MNYLIPTITNFHQELKVGRIKDQVGQLIQKYNMNFSFHQCLLVK